MAFYTVKSNDVDISDYVIDSGSVPTVERNRDWSQLLSELDIKLKYKTPSEYFAVGSEIKISTLGSSYPFYIGDINQVKENFNERNFEINIQHRLKELEQHKLTYSELHTLISSGATSQQYRSSDNQGLPSVQIVWVIKKMFEAIGVPLYLVDTLEIDNIAGNQIRLEHLRMDEEMLYCINQDNSMKHIWISNFYEDRENLVPTWWDFVKWFCQMIGKAAYPGFTMRWSDANLGTPGMIAIIPRGLNTFAILNDDKTYQKEVDDVQQDFWDGYVITLRYSARENYSYLIEPTDIQDFKISGANKKNSIELPNNFLILYERYITAPGDVYPVGVKITNITIYSGSSVVAVYVEDISGISEGTVVIISGVTTMTDANGQFTATEINTQLKRFKITLSHQTSQEYNGGFGRVFIKNYQYPCYPISRMAYNQLLSLTGDFSSKKYKTTSKILGNAKEGNINLAEHTSEFTEEILT